MTSYTIENLYMPSLANMRLKWQEEARLKSTQRMVGRGSTLKNADAWRAQLPAVVTLVRIGPRKLDSDNVAYSFKAFRDGVAEALGVNDGDDRAIVWKYAQERAPKGAKYTYGVRVEVRAKGEEAA